MVRWVDFHPHQSLREIICQFRVGKSARNFSTEVHLDFDLQDDHLAPYRKDPTSPSRGAVALHNVSRMQVLKEADHETFRSSESAHQDFGQLIVILHQHTKLRVTFL